MLCYLCGKKSEFFLEKNGFSLYRCPACGLKQTDLKKNYESFVTDHYDQGYFTGDPNRSAYSDYKNDKVYILRNMGKYLGKIQALKSTGKLLDVGCAMGFLVELATDRGYDAYGFDPSEFAVKEAQKISGKRIKHGSIHTVSYPKNSFDIITMFDVFEHLGDPKRDVEKLVSFLKPDGIIVIATGDEQSFLAKILKRRWTFYIPPQHLFFFNKRTLTKFLNSVGLSPKYWFRVGKWLSLTYVLHLARTTGESKFGRWLYQKLSTSRIRHAPVYLPVGDNMVVIAQKASLQGRA